jgi:predicted phosphodiesterase
MPNSTFATLPFSSSKTVSWIHIGDTHITRDGEQNALDLGRIVDEINALYADGGIDFVFVPGDIADDGSEAAYQVFRKHLDRLQLPWCGIVGDHDVHEESFGNFRKYISEDLQSAFTIGPYRFLRLNAFSVPKPDSFVLDEQQLAWIETELQKVEQAQQQAILLLHCYPSELKQGGTELKKLLQRYPVLLIDMGHTHYNELSNDGTVLYSATRSTGQIEEGPVGYSVTTIDKNTVSWYFVPLGSPSLLAITQPEDARLVTDRTLSHRQTGEIRIHAKVWTAHKPTEVVAHLREEQVPLTSRDGIFWTGRIESESLPTGTHELRVSAKGIAAEVLETRVRVVVGLWAKPAFADGDNENALGAWEERGLLGTQLGPNKNGKKW